ncbi:hypothetical protein ACHAXT_010915 [Thalassiosira profunda]
MPPSHASSTSAALATGSDEEHPTLSIAILGGGIAGLSCASQLLSQHKKNNGASCHNLEVTLFDTGRLRPGGRCSSRLPGDAPPPEVKNRSSGKYPPKKDERANRRSCDNEGGSNGENNNPQSVQVPENIRRAFDGAQSSTQNANSSRNRIVSSMGAVDHAAQILSISDMDADFGAFQSQLQTWLEEGTVEAFPEGSVCELFSEGENEAKLQSVEGDMYYGKGGMGSIPIALREHCLSFDNSDNGEDTGRSFDIHQDVWVSPSNGVKYIGNRDDPDPSQPQWELRAGKRSLGTYHRLVIAHNGKCADRIISRTPAKAFHSLLRTRFAPYVPQWGGKEMTLNSIYSLVFAIKSPKGGGAGMGGLSSPIAIALAKLSEEDKGVYTIMIKNEPNLRLLSCNTLKHHHAQNANADSNIEVYTLLSSAKFGKKHKGPQENLPMELSEKVVMKLLESLERSLQLKEGSVVESVVDLKLQLWGAAVPMNTWQSNSVGGKGADGFVYDATYGVGACGDWILSPSIAGAWESGRRLADWMLEGETSVGLPDRSSKEDGGKFVPSRAALESGIGTIPSSPNSKSMFEFPSNEQSNRRGGPNRSRRPGRGQNRSKNGNGRRSGGKSRNVAQPMSQG